jgi:serine/threonine protein kinase
MVIECLQGEDLEARLARQRRVETLEAATIAWQVARGLARAHAAGVIHRDLKPANVFLTQRDDGSVLAKILDFGISKLVAARASASGADAGAEPTLTQFGTTLGTPQYMSPEQCEGRAAIDGRTDVWSLCAVLYEMLAGEPAISDLGGLVAAMVRIVSKDVCPLADRAPWVPAELARVVDAGLAREVGSRIRDASTLADRLLDACPQASARPGPSAGRSARGHDDAAPPSSAEDGVELFVRRGDLPVPVARRKRR